MLPLSMRVGTDNDIMKRKVKVYDVDAKKLLKECESVAEAERFTGVSRKDIPKYIAKKWRSHNNKLNCTICFR